MVSKMKQDQSACVLTLRGPERGERKVMLQVKRHHRKSGHGVPRDEKTPRIWGIRRECYHGQNDGRILLTTW